MTVGIKFGLAGEPASQVTGNIPSEFVQSLVRCRKSKRDKQYNGNKKKDDSPCSTSGSRNVIIALENYKCGEDGIVITTNGT
jgi:hypothetical protein